MAAYSNTTKLNLTQFSLHSLSNPSVRFSALLFISMATTEPFLRRTKSGYLLYLVNYKDNTLPFPAFLQTAHSCPAIRNPSTVCSRNIIGRKKLVRNIQILKHLFNHGGLAYLTGSHHHLDELSWLFHPFRNYLIFCSSIHTITFYSVD